MGNPNDTARKCLRVVASGYVQGVGFRYFVQRQAEQAGVTGWVRNLANGDVELEVAGQSEVLDRFLDQLKTGHPWARVEALHVEPVDGPSAQQGFVIR